MSTKVTVTTEGSVASATPAVMTDIFTTVISTTEAVTGMYGFIQKAGIFALGMGYQNSRLGGGWNFLKSAN